MDAAFWQERWRNGETGWEQAEVNGLLARHWAALGLPVEAEIFVPLCGKSIDMVWLAARGHRILGVELVPAAIEAFFAGASIPPRRLPHRLGALYAGGPFRIVAGDAFALRTEDLSGCAGFYDRAALVALPGPMRRRYVRAVLGKLPDCSRGLLVSLEFPEGARAGPPFPVAAPEIAELFADWQPTLLERCDLAARDPLFAAGMPYAFATAWRLERPVGGA